MVHVDELERALEHTREKRFVRVLDDRDPAAPLHGEEPGRAVVASPAQDYAHDPRAVRDRRRAKEGVDRRTVAVFSLGP